MSRQSIRYEAHGAVRLVTLDRPRKMNALDFAANDELIEVWREFAGDDEARVAVMEMWPEKKRVRFECVCLNEDAKAVLEGEAILLVPGRETSP